MGGAILGGMNEISILKHTVCMAYNAACERASRRHLPERLIDGNVDEVFLHPVSVQLLQFLHAARADRKL